MTVGNNYYEENQDLTDIWRKCLDELKKEQDEAIFRSFFTKVELSSCNFNEGKATLCVPNELVKNQLNRRYSKVISKTLCKSMHLPEDQEINFSYIVKEDKEADSLSPIILKKEISNQAPDITANKVVNQFKTNKTNLNKEYNFNSFIVGKSNEIAVLAAKQLVENSDQNHPLYFYGASGLGKTHLLQAIGNYYLEIYPDARVYYTSSENFTNKLVAAIKAGKVEKFKQQIRSIDLLLMDEIQFLANKKHTQEEFLHTFNSLLERGSKIAMVADKMPKQLEAIDEKLKNRFSWGISVDFSKPDFNTRVAILKSKAIKKGLSISDEAVEAIAGSIKDNIRELEGIINRLTVVSSLRGDKVDLLMVENILSQINKPVVVEISHREIKAITANYFDLKVSDLESKRRLKTISRARQVAIYLIRKHTSIPYIEIGLYFGGRDHSSIIYSANKIEQELKTDQKLQIVVREIERRFS